MCKTLSLKYPKDGRVWIEKLLRSILRKKDMGLYSSLFRDFFIKNFKVSNSEKVKFYYTLYKDSKPDSSRAKVAARSVVALGKLGVEGRALRYYSEFLYKDFSPSLSKLKKLKLLGGQVQKLQVSMQQIAQSLAQLDQLSAAVLKPGDPYWGVRCL